MASVQRRIKETSRERWLKRETAGALNGGVASKDRAKLDMERLGSTRRSLPAKTSE
jgi:hypothetical protein